jgi:hypothetical protein
MVPFTAWTGFPGTDVYIASAGQGAGSGGSVWRTTLWIANSGTLATNCEIRLLIRNQANPSPDTYLLTVADGDTVRFDNTLPTLFGVDTFGVLQIVCAREVVVGSRIFNQPGGDISDTQGQYFGAIPASFAIGLGETTELIGVNQAADEAFRYNFGFVEVTGNQATADGSVTRSSEPYQGSLVGVYSTRPGVYGDLYHDVAREQKVPVAVIGIVPVKVCDQGGAILPGDLLTSSSTPGTAMRAAKPRPGAVIGKALAPHESGEGMVNMLVMLR